MSKRIFFSFDYKSDLQRVSHIRNCWVIKPDRETAGFTDAYSWEKLGWQGDEGIKKWIDRELERTFVTVVLIGSQTAGSELIDYEIKKSHSLGKGLLGIYIHNLKDKDGNTGLKGKNPFENFCVEKKGQMIYLSQLYPTYDWMDDDGYANFVNWVETAAKKAGR